MGAHAWPCALLAGLLFVSSAAAAPRHLAQWGAERWTQTDGLPGNWIREVLETPEGFLWVATGRGLVRFDGRQFGRPIPPGHPLLLHDGISALALDSQAQLWLGLDYGGLRVYSDGQLQAAPGWPLDVERGSVRSLVLDEDAVLWVGTTQGLWRQSGEQFEQIVLPTPGARVDAISAVPLPGGGVLLRTTRDGLWQVRGTPAFAEAVPDAPACAGHGVARGKDGTLYTSCFDGVWRRAAGSTEWVRISSARGVGRLLVDSSQTLWFGSRDGLTRWNQGGADVRAVDATIPDWRVRALRQDHRGDLWVGTYSGGLARVREGPVQSFGSTEGLQLDGPTAVLSSPDDSLWIGSERGGLVLWHPDLGVRGRWTEADGLPGLSAWSVAADPAARDAVWVGGSAGLGYVVPGQRRVQRPAEYAYSELVRLVYADPAAPGTLWLGNERGVVVLRPKTRRIYGPADGLPVQRVRFFHRDHQGRLLAGGELGLYRLDGDRWLPHLSASGRVVGLTAIAEEPDGRLWLASSRHGLLHVEDPQVRAYGLSDGLPFWPIHSLSRDAHDGLWLSGNNGLARLRVEDHVRWLRGEMAAIPFERLSSRDGLRDDECNGWGSPAVSRLRDGRLVYPTANGVALVDGTRLPTVALEASELYLSSITAQGLVLPARGPIDLAPEQRSLSVGYSAIELLRPEAVSFRYRLEGLDTDWVAADRTGQASYPHLGPGTYQFRLQGRLPGRDWIEIPEALPIHVRPRWFEMPAVRGGLALLALALCAFAIAWRMRVGARHAASLARARAFLREVIDTSPHPIFARDRSGRYTLANRAAAAIYGLLPADVEGRLPSELGPSDAGMQAVDALDADVIASGGERTLAEQRLLDRQGQVYWFHVVKRPGFSADGRRVEQVIGTAVDITSFKRAAEQLRAGEQALQESRDAARLLSHRLLHAQEEERRRLAREIHDDLSQRVAGLAMLAWSTQQSLQRERGIPMGAQLQELAIELQRVAQDVQSLSRELHPAALETLGLADALRAECANFSRRTGLVVHYTQHGDPQLPAEVALAFYRIAQEALRNCVAHAGVAEAALTLSVTGTEVTLTAEDTGAGFDARHAGGRAGLGLSSMRERAHLIGARFEMDSTPGRGTRLSVCWRAATALN